MCQSQKAKAVMVLLEETNGPLPGWPDCVLVLCRWNEARSRAWRLGSATNPLKQTQMLICPRQVVFSVSQVQEASVILILFLCWFVNYYSSIIKQNM